MVSRRRYTADLAAANAVADRLRIERDTARARAADWEDVAKTTARQFADADTQLRRLTEQEADPVDVDAWEHAAKAYAEWKPGPEAAIEGGQGRPLHPATILYRALARCRALEARLAAAESRPGGAS